MKRWRLRCDDDSAPVGTAPNIEQHDDGSGVIRSGLRFCFATAIQIPNHERVVMKKLCAVLTMLAILVVGLGFYRGWFALSSPASDAGSGTVNINLATDPGKMKQDAQAVKDKATELTGGVKEDVKADGQASTL